MNKKEKAIIQYTNEGYFVKEWQSASIAAKTLGISRTGIVESCRGDIKLSSNHFWKYKK